MPFKISLPFNVHHVLFTELNPLFTWMAKYYYLLFRSFHWLCLTLPSISSSESVSWPWSRMIEHSSTLEFRLDSMKHVNNKLLVVVCGIRWGRSVYDFYRSNKIGCILGSNLLPSSHPPWCTSCWPRCSVCRGSVAGYVLRFLQSLTVLWGLEIKSRDPFRLQLLYLKFFLFSACSSCYLSFAAQD